MEILVYLLPLFGVIALLYMAYLSSYVNKQDAGESNMKEIANHIADGAMAFLKAEYRTLAVFVVIAGALLAFLSTQVATTHWLIAVAFLIGASFSAIAGFIGMRIATKANVRTTQAARSSLPKALSVSFSGGSVMGLGVAGLAVFGLSLLFALFFFYFMGGEWAAADIKGQTMDAQMAMTVVLEVLAGFSLGAESIALFARVGGGIYTKAADVGADLVGKVEAGIPEDDLPHIFDPFYRSDEAKQINGTGLGLSIVQDCVDRHHGRIHVESTPGQGSTFIVELPVHDERSEQ